MSELRGIPWPPFYRIVEWVLGGGVLPQYRFHFGFPVVSAFSLGGGQFR